MDEAKRKVKMGQLMQIKRKIEKIINGVNSYLDKLIQIAETCLENDDEDGYNKILDFLVHLLWKLEACFKKLMVAVQKLMATVQKTKTTVKKTNEVKHTTKKQKTQKGLTKRKDPKI